MPSVITIGKQVFDGCNLLESVKFSTVELCENTFPDNKSICKSPLN